MSNLSLLDRAANATSCQILQNIGSGLVQASVVPLWTPKGQLIALGVGGATLLAANYLCPEFDVGDENPQQNINGCAEVSGTGTLWYLIKGAVSPKPYSNYGQTYTNIRELKGVYSSLVNGAWQTEVTWTDSVGLPGGLIAPLFSLEAAHRNSEWWLVPNDGGTCVRESDDTPTMPPGYDTPVSYTDNETNCTYNVSLQGFAQESANGAPKPVFLIESGPALRAEGGRVGGCNFSPVIYMPGGGGGGEGGGGGGGTYIPVPDGGPLPDGPNGMPWWAGPLAGAVASAVLNQIARMFGNSMDQAMAPAAFTLTAPCEKDEEGNSLTGEWTWDEQPYFERIHDQQVVIMEILQQHLNFKTPICGNETPIQEGDYRTISFRSETTSPYGRACLRKRFKYRSSSGLGLGAIVDHWKDFTFEAGPVIVGHSGASWGNPQVWAATEDEGKRVIRHAAREAGIDPDQVGRWRISSSNSARFGVSGSMSVDTRGGYYWITSRDGSNDKPIVALTSDP
jgi:hypothetical protein